MQPESRFDREVRAETLGQIRSFLDELVNGSSNYRSLHNLTQEIQHQYHGRFAVELLQNAHDAMARAGSVGAAAFDLIEEPSGAVLYVANSGAPFGEENFHALARIGQSSKDPAHDAGNKGIGFRSVLEVCTSPEVYSASAPEAVAFDGYCLRFEPDVERWLAPVLEGWRDGRPVEADWLAPGEPLHEWSRERKTVFQQRCLAEGSGWLRQELACLSPYALPRVVQPDAHATRALAGYRAEGFVSVVRLPLAGHAWDEVAARLRELEEASLFLAHLGSLRVRVGDDVRTFGREEGPPGAAGARRVTLTGPGGARRFVLWRGRVGGAGDPIGTAALRQATATLPGKWPQMDEADVALAVSTDADPETGRYHVFLPTRQTTGTGAHLNAPFFPHANRTSFDPGTPLNALLLERLGDLAWAAAEGLAAQPASVDTERAMAALVGVAGPGEPGVVDLLQNAALRQGAMLDSLPLFPSGGEWRPAREVRRVPVVEGASVLTPATFRALGTLPFLSEHLAFYEKRLDALAAELGTDLQVSPDEVAEAVAAVARSLHHARAAAETWTDYWNEVRALLPDPRPLLGWPVLLGEDGKLHVPREHPPVFAPPLRGEEATEVPDVARGPLRRHLAFLHPDIVLSQESERGQHVRSLTYRYLTGGASGTALVREYRREKVLDEGVLQAIPTLPVRAPESSRGKLCRAILRAASKLVTEVDRLSDLSRLPVPCQGGWFPAREAMFGPGWLHTVGEELARLAAAAGSDGKWTAERLLLPPEHSLWAGTPSRDRSFLARIGVRDGLRLAVASGDGQLSVTAEPNDACRLVLPANAPNGIPQPVWEAYRLQNQEAYRTAYKSRTYRADEPLSSGVLHAVVGPDDARDLTTVLLRSFEWWPQAYRSWETWTFDRQRGNADSVALPSPLFFQLQHSAWLQFGEDVPPRRPSECWWVPAPLLRDNLPLYAHLNPVPAAVVERLSPLVEGTLSRLGVRSYEGGQDATALLDALARAWDDGAVHVNREVFVGQVHRAWATHSGGAMPSRLVVRQGADVRTMSPSQASPCYLPDAAGERLKLVQADGDPVVVIETKSARKLTDAFATSFPDAVRRVSSLRVAVRYEGPPPYAGSCPTLWEARPSLAVAVLAVRAYHGEQSYGPHVDAFREAANRIRTTRLVEVERLRLAIEGDGDGKERPVSAWYVPKEATLFVERGRPSHEWANSLAAVLERADIETALKFVLHLMGEDPSDDEAERALDEGGVSRGAFVEVRQLLAGDWSATAFRLKPALCLLGEVDDAHALDGEDEERAICRISSQVWKGLDGRDLIHLARRAPDPAALGRVLYDRLGDVAELDRWNTALQTLGPPYRPTVNPDAETEYSGHLSAAAPLLGAAIRATASGPITEAIQAVRSMSPSPALAVANWSVPFSALAGEAATAMRALGLTGPAVEAVAGATSRPHLAERLAEAGVEIVPDPQEAMAHNADLVRAATAAVRTVALAWARLQKEDPAPWTLNDPLARVLGTLDPTGYARMWSGEGAYTHVVHVLGQEGDPFWVAAIRAGTPDRLAEALGVSAIVAAEGADLEAEARHRTERRQREVSICGVPFDSSEENLPALWALLEEAISLPSDVGRGLPPPLKLQELPARRKGKGRPGEGGGSPMPRLRDDERVVIGLAGEMLAYRYLRDRFGPEVVSASSWRSELSRHRFPTNTGSDTLGFDFEIVDGTVTLQLEVKATTQAPGHDDAVDLGASEVRAALEASRKRNVRWQILRVYGALGPAPTFEVVPNPFARDRARQFDLERSQLRVRFRRA